MATKILRDSTVIIQNGTRNVNTGNTTITGTRSRRQVSTCVATFSRPKPPCLRQTTLGTNDSLASQTSYTHALNPNTVRFGTADYVYAFVTTTKTEVEDSNGDIELARARHKISGKDANFGETLVELGETIGLINKRIGTAYKLFSAIRDGKWAKAASMSGLDSVSNKVKNLPPSKRLANGYLEFQFGWMPLMNDIHNVIEAYGKGLLTKGDKIRGQSGRATKRGEDGFMPTGKLQGSATASGIVKNEVLANLNNLGLANPALMAWNKLPFSFVVDWFLPITPILGSLTAGAGLNCYSDSKTSRYLNTIRLVGTGINVIHNQVYTSTRAAQQNSIDASNLLRGRSLNFGLGKTITSVALLRSLQRK